MTLGSSHVDGRRAQNVDVWCVPAHSRIVGLRPQARFAGACWHGDGRCGGPRLVEGLPAVLPRHVPVCTSDPSVGIETAAHHVRCAWEWRRGQRPCRRSAAPPCCAFTCGAGMLGLRRAGVATRGCLDCHSRNVCSNDALRELVPRRLPVVCAMAPPSVRHGRPSFLPALIGSRRTRDRTSTGLSCCCLCGASRCWCCR